MNNIKQQQNLPDNIRLLEAQRFLYSRAKMIFTIQIVLTVFVVIALNWMKLIKKEELPFNAAYISLISLAITLFDLLLFGGLISNLRTNAAKIQEQFDCNVYNMPWNKINSGNKAERHIIAKNAKKYISDPESPLENWYDIKIDNLPQDMAILRCQETNLFYDSELRERFKRSSLYCCILLFAIELLIGFNNNVTVQAFISNIVAPLLPAIALTIKIVLDNMKSIKASVELKKQVDAIEANKGVLTMENLRQIQDKIYCSRRDSALVPDWFYNLKRKELEEAMKDNADRE
ncbi:S-4TM family putative pore-forming effector [Chitinophaga silvisoli]|uniref:Uncharacterized protein n=1 Tax=Chitinophaga silvisoli TaxID=2291814 RepID=A0A3E1NVK3_9BACT|nr:S-4TM family putative pore-forming effector [Chitinophaga silvisoli]RFM31937.1 hypothetical protein DXN04_24420 [Chitinophaga silvisoli]